MRAKYRQPDGRAIVPRKWSACKTGGPLIYFAERVLKKLIQHGYAATYVARATNRIHAVVVDFDNDLGQTESFKLCLADCCDVVSRALRVRCALEGMALRLVEDLRLVVKGNWVSFQPTDMPPF